MNAQGPVKALIDEALSLFSLGPITTHLKQRIYMAEIEYRNHRRDGIALTTLVQALNQLASDVQGPPFLYTNQAQVELLSKWLPTLGFSPFTGILEVSSDLSPVTATGLCWFLLYHKVLSTEWQMSPDDWVKRFLQSRDSRENSVPRMIVDSHAGAWIHTPADPTLERRVACVFSRPSLKARRFLRNLGI